MNNLLQGNNRNQYVNNINDDYYMYNPDDNEQKLKNINNQLNEISPNQEIENITKPINITTNQYKTPYSQGSTMYDNKGKYFDLYDFNKNFDSYIEQQQKERLLNEKLKLTDLSTIESIKISPYQLPIDKIMINIKDTWFEIYDNLLKNKNPFSNFNEDKFFYIGISLIIIALIYIIFIH